VNSLRGFTSGVSVAVLNDTEMRHQLRGSDAVPGLADQNSNNPACNPRGNIEQQETSVGFSYTQRSPIDKSTTFTCSSLTHVDVEVIHINTVNPTRSVHDSDCSKIYDTAFDMNPNAEGACNHPMFHKTGVRCRNYDYGH